MIDEGLRRSLESVYDGRLDDVLKSLHGMGPWYYFRLNSLVRSGTEIVESLGSQGLNVKLHGKIHDAAGIPVTERTPSEEGMPVRADRFAAEAVMQGAHLYAPGVKECRGLRRGMKAVVTDENGLAVGSGVAQQGETAILRHHRGIAVETHESRFGLRPLRETLWYNQGEIHLQSLPSMVTCHVLDPEPGDVIVDLNCSPAGKMSYLSQLTGNNAKLIGFDRNIPKIERAREHLERLHCRNYRLVAHDSRYVHVDFTLNADKVLVDPPCTGLGVMPKLSIKATMADVLSVSEYQKQFLRAAASIVKKGGIVVYSVCTITSEECDGVVKFAKEELGLVETGTEPTVARRDHHAPNLSQRFDPEIDGAGFFIAKFIKT